MADDDDVTTLGEYFEPIPFLPTSPAAPPVSAELVRILTSDIRTATRTRVLNTPALAEALVGLGWRPAELVTAPLSRRSVEAVHTATERDRVLTLIHDRSLTSAEALADAILAGRGPVTRESAACGCDLSVGPNAVHLLDHMQPGPVEQDDLDGATVVGDLAAYASTPGEFAARWNARTPEERAAWLRVMVDAVADRAHRLSTERFALYRSAEGNGVARVGTRLIGDEGYGPTTIRITYVSEQTVLAVVEDAHHPGVVGHESRWDLTARTWSEVPG